MDKKIFSLITSMLLSIIISAQNFNISFTGTGQSTVVESVKVENLTQCTSVEIAGDDVLNLVDVLGTKDMYNNNRINIYPNPFDAYCNIELEIPISGLIAINISDINGKQIFQQQKELKQGKHNLKLSGIKQGIYIMQIESAAFNYTAKLISIADAAENTSIINLTNNDTKLSDRKAGSANTLKSTSSIVQMQYNSGDVLKLTGKSGNYRTVQMLVPTANQTVSFTFMACTDANGNNYAVVKIGNRWWMAENLNSGTYVTIATPQVSGTKFCMDINGQDDPTCPMGGLYEWENLMQGATPCNGTGAYPNDKCDNPVKGLCPLGWHIPSHYEWTTLARNSGNNPNAFPYDMSIGILGLEEGGNLKEKCTTYWWAPNEGATNITGFSGLPGGDTWAGIFEDFGQSAYFWTTSLSYTFLPWVYALNYSLPSLGRSFYVRENGFSCRCVKD